MDDIAREKLNDFYLYIRSQIEASYYHYRKGGQHTNNSPLFNPSVRKELECVLKDLGVLTEANDFPWNLELRD